MVCPKIDRKLIMRLFSCITSLSLLLVSISGTDNKVIAQNPSKEFLGIFDRETTRKSANNRFANFRNIKVPSFFPDTLPEWFFHLPPPTIGAVFSIGISDPDMPIEMAMEQAINRARVLAILGSGSKIEFIRDIYTVYRPESGTKGYRDRFDSFFRVSSAGNFNDNDFTIIHKHFTRFNEAIVLLKYKTPETAINCQQESISAIATLLFIEAQVGEVIELQSSYEILSRYEKPGVSLVKNSYNLIRKGKREQAISKTNGVVNNFPLFVYRYSNPGGPPFTQPLISYYGLWTVFIRDYLGYILHTSEQSILRLKNMEQKSHPEVAGMVREIASFRANIEIHSLEITSGEIIFEMGIEEQ